MVNTFLISQKPNTKNLYLIPNADLTGCTDHTPVGDSPNYACIDDPIDNPDEDATYVYAGIEKLDLFELPNSSLTGTINHVNVYTRAKSHEYPQGVDWTYKIAISPAGTCTDEYLSNNFSLITTYNDFQYLWTNNPVTSNPWSWANINSMCIGFYTYSTKAGWITTIDTFRPNAEGTYCGLEGAACANCGTGNHQVCVINFDNKYASSINLETGCPGADGTWATDTFDIPNHTTQFIRPDKVVIVAIMGKTGNCEDHGWIVAVPSDGATYEYETENLPHAFDVGWGTFTEELLVHPTTGQPWTWTDIDGLEIGYKLQTLCNDDNEVCFRSYCNQIYLLVYSRQLLTPKIRTTQCYARVNYSPPTDYCRLNRPDKISNNHSRNIKMINFWSGNREVYDLNRSGKSMLLTGTEFYHADATDLCARIECVENMAKEGSPIVITDLGNDLWNGTYQIRSFGWKHMLACPDWYEWMLELEDTRHAEVGDGYD